MHFGKDNYPGNEYFWQTLSLYWWTFSLAIKVMLIGYAVLLVFFLIFGNKKERMFFLVSLVVLVLVCLNPWMAWYLVENWGFELRYFRLFWIIPVAMGYTVFVMKIYEKFRKLPVKIIIFIFVIALYVFSFEQVWEKSFEVYTGCNENTGLVPVSNIYKVEDDVVIACDLIEEDSGYSKDTKVTLYDSYFYIEARTYDALLVPIYPYANYQTMPLDEAIESGSWSGVLSDAFTGTMCEGQVHEMTPELMVEAVKHMGVQYVILYKDNSFADMWLQGLELLGESDYYYVLKSK